jgi:chromosome segregation ATPase
MAEIDSNLIYEVLKKIQSRLDGLEHGIREIKQELVSIRGHMLSMQNDVHNIYGILGRHDDRLDRIERRLELRELAEPQRPVDPAT